MEETPVRQEFTREIQVKVVDYLERIGLLDQLFATFDAMANAGAPQDELEIALITTIAERQKQLKTENPDFETEYEAAFIVRVLKEIYPERLKKRY